MTITETASKRLAKLLPKTARGFRIEGWVGTCRGSTPVLKPASEPREDEVELTQDSIVFFAKRTQADILQTATLDYESGFLGRGLRMTWPHNDKCACQGD